MKAKDLGKLGKGSDSLVAHINPFEAVLLAAHGGSGTVNPKTGLLQFNNGADGQGDKGSEGDQGPGGSSGPGGEGVGPSGHGATDSPGTAGGGNGIGGDTSFGGWTSDPTMGPNAREDQIGYAGGGVNWSEYAMQETFTATQAQMAALAGAKGLAERNALANNRYDPNHPAVARGRAIDAGTAKAQGLLDRLAEAFNPMTTYNALFNEKPPDAVTVANQVVNQISGPVGVAMTAGRALSEYALDQGWSIDYGYESVMGGSDSSEQANRIREMIRSEAGIKTPEAPAPESTTTVVSAVPGYRSLLGGGYDGFSFLGSADQGVNRSTRRFA